MASSIFADLLDQTKGIAAAETSEEHHRLGEQPGRAIKCAYDLRMDVATIEANVVEMTGADGKGREWEGVARQRLKRVWEKLRQLKKLSAREDQAIKEGEKVKQGAEELCWCCGVM